MFARIKRWWINLGLKASYEERFQWLERMALHLDAIAESSEVKDFLPEAIERIEYFRQRQVYVMPSIDQFGDLTLDHWTEPKEANCLPLLVYPAFQSDAEISLVANHLVGRETVGSYSARGHAVIAKIDCGETDRFMATTLIHEIGHACAAEKEGRILQLSKSRPREKWVEEELRLWTFDSRLVGFLGGKQLRDQIDSTAREICQAWAVQGNDAEVEARIDGGSLDLCYGPAISEKARNWRRATYLAYCQLVALHMFLGPVSAHEHQLALIAHLHKSSFDQQEEFVRNFKK